VAIAIPGIKFTVGHYKKLSPQRLPPEIGGRKKRESPFKA